MRLLAALWLMAGLSCAVIFGLMLVEICLRPGPLARIVLVRFIGLPVVVGAGAWLLWRWLRGMDLRAVAGRVQELYPGLGRRLEGALDLYACGEESALVRAALGQTAKVAAKYDFAPAARFEDARRIVLPPLLASLLLGGMLVAFPGRARNAIMRLAAPYRVTTVVGRARITSMEPGRDVEVVEGGELAVRVSVDRPELVRKAVIRLGRQVRRLSRAGKNEFVYFLRDLRENITYQVEIGGSRSRIYGVRVIPRPTVAGIAGEIEPPAYTGMKRYAIGSDSGAIRAPVGSRVHLRIKTNHPVTQGHVRLSTGMVVPLVMKGKELFGDLDLSSSGTYTISLLDGRGNSNANPVARPMECIPDAVPRLHLKKPEKNVKLGLGQSLQVVVGGRDDYGLREVVLMFRRNRRGEPQVLKRWRVSGGNVKEAALPFAWKLSAPTFDVGDVVAVYAQATDFGPGRTRMGRSQMRYISIVNPAKIARKDIRSLEKVRRILAQLLEKQKRIHRATGMLKTADKAFTAQAGKLALQQKQIRGQVIDASGMLVKVDDRVARRIRVVLLGLGANELATATSALLAAGRATEQKGRRAGIVAAIPAQAEVIKRLGQIIGIIPKLQEKIQGPPEKEKGEDLPADAVDALQKLKKNLDKFKSDQRKVIDATRDLTKKNVDDFTDEDRKKLEDLKALEENWANFLKDVHSDLSKVPKQDFSNPALLGEVLAVLEEVELAEGAMTQKEVEIATEAASTGMELAESMTTHLEKWLPDKPDRIAWKMEEPLSDYEVPMAELPEKLEDIVGELTEQEEELMEEADDASSSWADSLDKGAGWDALDGPISNYSAQGVTGNQLPNTSEIGGRSGEGRQGKSHGEMVSDTAVGKGGRKTPSRLTPDSFEKGQIKDQSKDASGGATGGGKGGAAGAEGLEGPPPPPEKGPLPRLLGKQAELRNKAERLNLNLKLMGYNSSVLENTLSEMRSVETELKNGRYKSAARRAHYAVNSLKTAKDAILGEAAIRADRAAGLPRELQREIMDALDAGLPKGYEDLVKAYYEKLATGDSK